jgi:hypothetical protein
VETENLTKRALHLASSNPIGAYSVWTIFVVEIQAKLLCQYLCAIPDSVYDSLVDIQVDHQAQTSLVSRMENTCKTRNVRYSFQNSI